jgi:integrase
MAHGGSFRWFGWDSASSGPAVGDHPREAKQALASQNSVLDLRGEGMAVEDAPQIQAYRPVSGPRLADTIAAYIAHPPAKLQSKKSRAKYFNALRSFQTWTRKTHVTQLDRSDVLGFMSHMIDGERLDPSTAVDKAVIVHSVMNEAGADIRMKRGDWPKAVAKEREVYEPHILKALFAAASQEEADIFRTYLLSGFREQEVSYMAWTDFNPRKNTLRVSAKKALGFTPKTYQERTIVIDDTLVAILSARRARSSPDDFLIFPTSQHNTTQGRPGGQRDRHHLDKLKHLAYRAGLNCGQCVGTWQKEVATCAERPICKRFGLHMFRHTYGMDIVTLQTQLGHADLDSTRKYLRAMKSTNLLEKVRSSSLASRFIA